MKTKTYISLTLLVPALFVAACQPPGSTTVSTNVALTNSTDGTAEIAGQPSITAAPTEDGENGYKIIAGDNFKLTVRAADASETTIFYQPITASDRALKLKTLTESSGDANEYIADLKIPEDFNGEVWAQIKYKNGELKETEHLLMARRDALEANADNRQPQTSSNTNSSGETNPDRTSNADSDSPDKSADSDESMRSDKMTGGRIEHAALKTGGGNVSITVNVPAFTMTFWQDGKEIKTYYVGVGRKQFPIPVGMRSASKIILNPDWIPPDSEWVRKSANIEPYERIPADDPQNPLGKIKIPLGDAYLLHEAAAPSDIGNLVSHGCVRVLRDNLFELTGLIAQARNLSIGKTEIEAARKNTDRRVLDLNGSIPVDINYDSMVVENGVLTIYPDVYERKTNTLENLRSELESYQIDVSKLDDKTLETMLGKVSKDEKFVVSLADIKAGNTTGKTAPLTPQQAKKSGQKSKK